MPDGTVYAGISPDTHRRLYTTPEDVPFTWKFNDAQRFALDFKGYAHEDWRVPTKGELNVLFQNRATIGGFSETGSGPVGWYWSSSQYNTTAWEQRFNDGRQLSSFKDDLSSLRLVR